MTHYVLLFNGTFGYTRAMLVSADRFEARNGALYFYQSTQLEYQVPESYVTEVRPFESQRDGDEFIKAFLSRTAGAATFHVQEYGVAATKASTLTKRQGGFLAEGVSVRIAELTPRRKKD